MMAYKNLKTHLQSKHYSVLITVVAGFIDSNLLEALRKLNQKVVDLDNFSTGQQRNLDEVQSMVTMARWQNFRFMQADIRKLSNCNISFASVDYVPHQAAYGGVLRSLEDGIDTNVSNFTRFFNVLFAARNTNVNLFVYAASSSTYGNHQSLPKVENQIGKPLSPYAFTKYLNELYADVFCKSYGLHGIGLRYFNVFCPREDPGRCLCRYHPQVDLLHEAGIQKWRERNQLRLLLHRQCGASRPVGRHNAKHRSDKSGLQNCSGRKNQAQRVVCSAQAKPDQLMPAFERCPGGLKIVSC